MSTTFRGVIEGVQYASSLVPGSYISNITGSSTGGAATDGELTFSEIILQSRCHVDRLGTALNVLGTDASGVSTRLGLYTDDGNGAPLSLIVDAGAFPSGANGALNANEIPVNVFLDVGRYWGACLTTGVVLVGPFIAAVAYSFATNMGSVAPNSDINTGWRATQLSGPLPRLAPALTLASGVRRLYLRV